MVKLLSFLFKKDIMMSGDLSKHRVYTTNYQDLCM